MATLEITQIKRTIVVKFGRQIENISADKSLAELIDSVKWAAITMGARIDEIVISNILKDLGH